MQFHLIVVSFSVADPGEVAPKGPQFFFGDWASLLSQGLDKHSATDSSIHETVVRNPIDLRRGRPQVIQIPSGLPLPEVKIAKERCDAFVILYHLQTVDFLISSEYSCIRTKNRNPSHTKTCSCKILRDFKGPTHCS